MGFVPGGTITALILANLYSGKAQDRSLENVHILVKPVIHNIVPEFIQDHALAIRRGYISLLQS